jgi:prolyl oligopeptidase
MKNIVIVLFLTTVLPISVQSQGTPSTQKRPVTNEYHGVKVTEEYRWLENFDDADVIKWTKGENEYSRAYLDSIPFRNKVFNRLKELLQNRSLQYKEVTEVGGRLFALKDDPKTNQPKLVTLNSADDVQSERMILDPEALNPKGTTAIDWFAPSSDGKMVAVSLSDNGSEDGTLHIVETEHSRQLSDVVPRVQYPTSGGSVAWQKDGSGFYYTRYPHEGERAKEETNFYQQVYYHRLGSSANEDVYVIGREFPRIAEIRLESNDDGYLLVSVANGDGGEFAHYVMTPEHKWMQVTKFSDKAATATFGKDNMYLLSRQNAPRGKILKLPLSNLNLSHAKTIVPQSEVVIDKFTFTSDRLYIVDLIGGPNQIRMFDLDGNAKGMIPTKPISSVAAIVSLANDDVLYTNASYTEPTVYYRYGAKSGQSTKTSLMGGSPVDFSDTEVVREFATSKDGAKIPMSIIRRKGIEMNGPHPTLLYGYGGYNISLTPQFKYWLRMWIEQGGVYAESNIRGGGEYGEQWHTAGNLTKKQNVFDDFAACAQWLVENKYTTPSKLAIMGASNGGLLMGATLTQHPDMFKAVVGRVGIYDMLRVELSPNGAFNTTEFGTVKNTGQFTALYKYSPYHNVKDGAAYPAVLMTTGDHDGRVDPMQSRKMIARLQAATSSGSPILLRTSAHAGHGMGTSQDEFLSEQTDIFVFLLQQLGMGFTPVVP